MVKIYRETTVAEMIQELMKFNPKAQIQIVANNQVQEFEITYGHQGEVLDDKKCNPSNCTLVGFYLPKTNSKDNEEVG